MKRILMTTAAFGLAAGMAQAGGVERSHSPYGILWEKGNYAELSFGHVSPDVSGTSPLNGSSSGNMLDNYTQLGLGVKYSVNDQLDLAIVLDQPIGANVAYPAGSTPPNPMLDYPLAGSTGKIDSTAITALARYKFDGGFSVHGGVKAERIKGKVALPARGYSMTTSTETDFGYLIGAAYEKPEIALRVALTYQSEIKHDLDASENGNPTEFTTVVPQSVTLDFQSGVAKDTLVFGSVRWREWSKFEIAPPLYALASGGGTLVDYEKDVVTWTLGVGRRFNENWSGAISFGYEKATGLPTGNLGPHDGMKSITIGGSYTKDNMKITGGVSYVKIGDAITETIGSEFTDNHAIGVGMKIGWSF